MITSKTKLYAIIGDPVQHSLSPVMRNAAFTALNLDCAYVALRVTKENLKAAVDGMNAMEFGGFNATMPHKKALCALVDEIDEFAEFCEAVNTVDIKNGKLFGYNTDGPGTLEALQAEKADISECVVIGAGGAGRAIAYALAKNGSNVTILNRDMQKAKSLADKIQKAGFSASAGGLEQLEAAVKTATTLCHVTPIGLHEEASIVPATLLRKNLTVMDAVYRTKDTPLIADAKKAGCKTVPGWKMLLYQGRQSFERWTGKKAPMDVMEQALRGAMA
ncbi:MAG: shikimate dehydrogenase [Candidatus Micrarchaeota archaeon]|nr:shikimate dehydrogenase [Candidatus Micrarchaeota archaeon]